MKPQAHLRLAGSAAADRLRRFWRYAVTGPLKRTLPILLAIGAMALSTGPAPADETEDPGVNGKDSTQGVYVRDSAVALEKMALAQRMQRLREWDKSADVFQEILEQYPDRVVQSRVDEQGRIYQYTSVSLSVRRQLAQWPAEGLAAYNARYEPTAAALLRQAGADDFAALHEVYARYFITDSGRQAGLRLVDLYFRSGEFSAAAWIGDEMLQWHPALGEARAELLFQVALAYHLGGDSPKARQRLGTLSEKFPQAAALVGGKSTNLVDALRRQLDAPPARRGAPETTGWPMFMGAPDRARIPSAAGRMGARVYSAALHPGKWASRGNDQVRQFRLQAETDRKEGAMLGVFPAIDNGELFFQDGGRVYAVALESGIPLPGWAQTYGGQRQGQYITGGWGMPRGQLLTVALTADRVLAVLNQPDRVAALIGQILETDRVPRLTCLDRAGGAVLWTIAPRQLPESAGAVRDLSLAGAPLVVGDSVYVAARGGKGNQFEDCHVLCFDLRDGAFRWACYVAGATTGNPQWGDQNTASSDTVPQLAYANGRVYVLTNLGALAALDAYRGAIVWLSLYPRDAVNAADLRFRQFTRAQDGAPRPWTQNPVIVREGRIFAMPRDAQQILVYDAGSGEQIKRISRIDAGHADTLVGVLGDRLVVAGRSALMCLNWPAYDAATFTRTNADMLYWPKTLAGSLRGRPFMTDDSVFVCTAAEDATWQLTRIDLATGMARDAYPPENARSDDVEEPGNVIVAGDHVVVAGSTRVNVYTDMTLARARLDAEVAAAPDDPTPRLRYAEMMFAAGQVELALGKLDEAIELLGGTGALRAGAARDRLFIDALTFARALAQSRDANPRTMALVQAMFDRAQVAADSASRQVDYRVSRARFCHTIRDFAQETALYQQILLDPALRVVMLVEEGGTAQAGSVAERAIDGLIRNVGASVYAPFEQAAADARQAARGDPAALLDVAQRYPNAAVAPPAMLEAARAYETAGEARLATVVLRRIYFKYPATADRARVIEAMARNYLALPNHLRIAIARLAGGAALPEAPRLSEPMKLPDGSTLPAGTPFGQAVAALRQIAATIQAPAQSLPDVALPPAGADGPALIEVGAAMIADVNALVPIDPEHPRWDRLVTWSDKTGLTVYPAGDNAALYRSTDATTAPIVAAWLDQRLLVLGETQLLLLDGAGKTQWKLTQSALPAVELAGLGDSRQFGAEPDESVASERIIVIDGEPVALPPDGLRVRAGAGIVRSMLTVPPLDPGAPERFAQVSVTSDRVLLGTSTGRIVSVELATGLVAWQTRLTDGRPVQRLLTNEDFTVVQVLDESAGYLVVLDALSGQILHRWRFEPNSGTIPLNLALAPEGMLVYTLPDRIRGKDLYEPDAPGGEGFTWETRGQNGNEPLFAWMTRPGQLLLSDRRVIALGDRGQYVRVYALRNGQTLGDAGPDAPAGPAVPLSTGIAPAPNDSASSPPRMRAVGDMLYLMGSHSVQAYNLAHPRQKWRTVVESLTLRELFVTRGHLVVVDDPLDSGKTPRGACRLLAFSRAATPGGESGRLDHAPAIDDLQGIVSVQPVDGGFYYLAADGRVHFLRGAADH